MSASLPPDLRVLCRKLTSIPPAQLPHALPSLTNHILRCKAVLSSPQDQKLKDDASQSSVLVHKLKLNITTLLNGRSREARFAAIGLVKAVIDVGGWEALRGSGPWVQGLLSIVQKSDPFASKELAIIVLTKIFVLVQPYQTLIRELATPNIPAFASACLQLIKPKASGQPLTTPLSVIETICDAFSTLTPLYPATFRPSSSHVKTATKPFLAPTLEDAVFTPQSLRQAARRVNVSQHFVAAKSSGTEEWCKLVDDILKELHSTADQVLRAVNESWEPANGQSRTTVELDGEPRGGGSSADQLPAWSGVQSGADRLVGLYNYLAACLRYPTKSAVPVPITALMDAISRVCLIARQSPKSQTWDQALETNASIGREEKEDLWSAMPQIHVAAIQLAETLFQRMGEVTLPLVPEALDHLVRVFKSGIDIPAVRVSGYRVLNQILPLAGPTMSKAAVDILEFPIRACGRDLQQDAGFIKPTDKPVTSGVDAKKNGAKNGTVANVDMFLQPQASVAIDVPGLDPEHKAAAAELLTAALSYLPQLHLKPVIRGLLDSTAIVSRNRDAMFSSVLNAYRDKRGRQYPSILPHLCRQYSHDQSLEILRSNLRTSVVREMLATEEDIRDAEEEDAEEDEVMEEELAGEDGEEEPTSTANEALNPGTHPTTQQVQVELPIQPSPFEPRHADPPFASGTSSNTKSSATVESPPKRKHEGSDTVPAKRQELEKPRAAQPARLPSPVANTVAANNVEEDDGDDSDASVHLNMELDDDDDDDDEEEDN